MPHEPFVRRWLRGARVPPEEIDELIQDGYCRFAMLDAVDHIERPDIYFFSMVRHQLGRRRKRARVVPIDTMSDLGEFVHDEAPSPEREVAGQLAFGRLKTMLEDLPERCRRIIEMRKFDGLSQREIASTLGITESMVENNIQAGLRQLRAAWAKDEALASEAFARLGEGGRRA
ncbi:sigma-70 family RNA polymerase sigma factor [Sphingomonas colocasiae]|uniref:Sigma-70 family RNA polymerase sigma factor n=1 Tax=Sphingomonas colocasiae TaxID=1848973 RepID=A0ABS7PPH9_9SPHN|nr:sigma-70 family RNA polymerase sigma factor [Sphingomonas colocasiae]